jgi:hypothetical protein
VAAPVVTAGAGLVPVVAGGVAAVGGGTTAINAYNNFTGNNFLTNNNPERTKNNWSGALDVLETGTAVLPFASKNGRNAMFGADARARTLATGKSIWNGASRAWNGAGNIASRTVNGIGNMANRTVSGAKNGLLNAGTRSLGLKGSILRLQDARRLISGCCFRNRREKERGIPNSSCPALKSHIHSLIGFLTLHRNLAV